MQADHRARPLEQAAFSAYGKVVEKPHDVADAKGSGWTWWAETALLPKQEGLYAIGYLELEPAPLEVTWIERHRKSVEGIIPLTGSCLIYVGTTPLDIDVFRLEAGQGVVLDYGIWHGAPLAIDGPLNALIILAQGAGANDTEKEWFEEPISISGDGQ